MKINDMKLEDTEIWAAVKITGSVLCIWILLVSVLYGIDFFYIMQN